MRGPNVQSLLSGTPYLLPDDCDVEAEVGKLQRKQEEFQGRLAGVILELQRTGLYSQTSGFSRKREIFESNAIEGVGPDFKTTSEILSSELSDEATRVISRGMLLRTLASEQKVIDVLGLHGAKSLAEGMVENALSERPLTEVDIRNLHAAICNGEPFAGSYRTNPVEISGARHVPPEWYQVPEMMGQLSRWVNDTQQDYPVALRAAVLHAWFTHIHPFSDGNGRLARILVNILMARARVPIVILRHKADRARYLDALAHSDEAGDILPFAGTFIETQRRLIKEMEKPYFITRVFNDELENRGSGMYDMWLRFFNDFVEKLVLDLNLRRLRVQRVGGPDRTSYELLREGDSAGNLWFMKVADSRNRELLIWLGFSSTRTASSIDVDGKLPAMYFSVRSQDSRTAPYRRLPFSNDFSISEVVVTLDYPSRVLIAGRGLRLVSADDASEIVAAEIYRAFSSSVIP